MSTLLLTPVPLVLAGVSLSPNNFYYSSGLTGVVDGVNKTFVLPFGRKYVQNLGIAIQVFINGAKQLSSSFVPTEGGGLGTGYDRIVFNTAPTVGTVVTADYITP